MLAVDVYYRVTA